jgi:hypothetical protein
MLLYHACVPRLQALFDLEATNQDLKPYLRDLYITSAKEIETGAARKAILVHVRYWFLKDHLQEVQACMQASTVLRGLCGYFRVVLLGMYRLHDSFRLKRTLIRCMVCCAGSLPAAAQLSQGAATTGARIREEVLGA